MTGEKHQSLRALILEQATESRRHMQALGEHFTSQVQVIAEGHLLLQEKLDRLAGKSKTTEGCWPTSRRRWASSRSLLASCPAT